MQYSAAILELLHWCQLLHHIAALGLLSGLYVQADMSSIIRVRKLSFPPELRHRYIELLGVILWVLKFNRFVDNLIDYPETRQRIETSNRLELLRGDEYPYWRDTYSVAQTFALAKIIRSFPTTPVSCSKLKPARYHLWNLTKSHDDTGSEDKKRITENFHTSVAGFMALLCLDTQTSTRLSWSGC